MMQVVTWNVLADCYSGPGNDWSCRSQRIEEILLLLQQYDIFFLQEVDHFDDFYEPLFTRMGFGTSYVRRPTKSDGSLLAYSLAKYELVCVENILFDDLALNYRESHFSRNSLLRHNVAVMALLRVLGSDLPASYVLACSTHLYWNPAFPEVKCAQTTYLLDRIHTFRSINQKKIRDSDREQGITGTTGHISILLGGDFNSTPDSDPYRILTSLFSTCSCVIDLSLRKDTSTHSSGSLGYTEDMHSSLAQRYLGEAYYGGANTKFLCDSSLSKLCRWLRVLGLDATMYFPPPAAVSESSEAQQGEGTESECDKSGPQKKKVGFKSSTKAGSRVYDHIFAQATAEKRVILTTSKGLRMRAACPESMLVNAHGQSLQDSLVALFERYRLPLDREKFLTVCGKCGGGIVACEGDEYRQIVLEARPGAAESEGDVGIPWVPEDRQIFMCKVCYQPYWWNERENSSPARAMVLAHELFDLIESRLGNTNTSTSLDLGQPNDPESAGDGVSMQQVLDCDERQVPLAELFRSRDQTLSRMLECSGPTECSQSVVIESALSATADASGEDRLETAARVDQRIMVCDPADHKDVGRAGIHVRTTTTSMCTRCRQVMSVHPPLRSAMSRANGVEPQYTNWTSDFTGTLDYLFVTEDMAVQSAHVFPRSRNDSSLQETATFSSSLGNAIVAQDGPFPNGMWPSDHLLIEASFVINPR